MKDKNTQMWIPMYVDKWLFGSTRLELEPGERSVFVDLLMMGAKDNGFIRANETIPYPPRQLAAFLNITEELLLSTISKCIHFGKLEEVSAGMWRVSSWDKFQLSKSYKSELENGKKVAPGVQRTESSPLRTNGSLIEEEKKEEEKRVEEKKEEKKMRFAPPKVDEVAAYINAQSYPVDAARFCAYYESNGWKVGRNPMKCWKAAVRTWATKAYGETPVNRVGNTSAPVAGKYSNVGEKANGEHL